MVLRAAQLSFDIESAPVAELQANRLALRVDKYIGTGILFTTFQCTAQCDCGDRAVNALQPMINTSGFMQW